MMIKIDNIALAKAKKEAGFTLLEVLIALVILSFGLLSMGSLTASVIRTNSFSNDYTAATALAQDQLEKLFNTTFGGLTNGNDIVNADGNAGSKFNRSWTIGPGTATKTIQVDISWTNDYGNTVTISISTIRSS